MEQPENPAVQRHRLRAELRSLRENAGLPRREVASALVWSESKIVRIEAGQVGISHTDLKALCDLYGVTGSDQLATLTQLAAGSRRQPWGAYRDVLNTEFLVYLGYEGIASRLRSFQAVVVPGLLQTEEYARALMHATASRDMKEERIDRLLTVRMRRKELFDRNDPPQMHFVMDESALRRVVGPGEDGQRIMQAQLKHLIFLAHSRSVRIQVLPFSCGMHTSLGVSFVLLELAAADEDLLYIEGVRGRSSAVHDGNEIELYKRAFSNLAEVAVDLTEAVDSFLYDIEPLSDA